MVLGEKHGTNYLPCTYKQTFDKKKDPDSLETPDHQGHSLF